MSRKSDISHEPIDDLASKLINYLTASVKKVPWYVKRCKSISKFDRIAEHFIRNLTLNVLQSCQICLIIHTF